MPQRTLDIVLAKIFNPIENISLVHNYRSQFAAILRDKPPGQMIEKLKQKIISQ